MWPTPPPYSTKTHWIYDDPSGLPDVGAARPEVPERAKKRASSPRARPDQWKCSTLAALSGARVLLFLEPPPHRGPSVVPSSGWRGWFIHH